MSAESFLNNQFAGKWGSVFTVTIMMVGCILLTLTGIGLDGHQMVIWYIIAQVNFLALILGGQACLLYLCQTQTSKAIEFSN